MAELQVEYRITGLYRMDFKSGRREEVEFNPYWTLEDAQCRLAEIRQRIGDPSKKATPDDFDIFDLRIESRTCNPWKRVGE